LENNTADKKLFSHLTPNGLKVAGRNTAVVRSYFRKIFYANQKFEDDNVPQKLITDVVGTPMADLFGRTLPPPSEVVPPTPEQQKRKREDSESEVEKR